MTLVTTHSPSTGQFTVPGMTHSDSTEIIDVLQDRLNALTDLHLTLKHIHWNVVGPQFVAIHTMLDPHVDAVRKMADAAAERITTLGGSPSGTPGALVAARKWDDYAVGRADALAHMAALDLVYRGVIESYRGAIGSMEKFDPITHDLLIKQAATLEHQHWFVRAHLENADGELATDRASSELEAAATQG